MRKNRFFIFLIAGVFLFSMVSLISADQLTYIVSPTDGSGNLQPNILYNFNFTFMNSSTCGTTSNLINNFYVPSVTLDSLGRQNISIDTTGITNLTQATYICVYGNNSLITSFPNPSFTANNGYFHGNVNASGNITGNYGFFSYLGGLLNRITNIFATNIDVSNQLNGTYVYQNGHLVWDSNNLQNMSQLTNDVPYALNSSLGNYILTSEEGNLNVHSSTYWNGINSFSGINNQITLQGENITAGTISFARLPTLTNKLTLDWRNITNKVSTDFNYGVLSSVANITDFPTSNSQFSNGNNYWNDTFATFNKTYADTLYYGTGSLVNISQFVNDVPYALNSTFSNYYTSTQTDTQINNANTSVVNWVQGNYYTSTQTDALTLSHFSNDLGIGNWSNDKSSYSTTSQANNLYYGINNPNSYYNSTTLTTNSQFSNGNNYWNDTFATFNKTYADTLYYGTGSLVNISQFVNDVPYALNSSLDNYRTLSNNTFSTTINAQGGVKLTGNETISSTNANTNMYIDETGNVNFVLG